MFRYTRSQINDIATRKRFIANTTEKVLRLYDILEFIGGWQDRDLLVLKGGTAINLCILELPRLSVDIDFDFSVNCNRQEMFQYREYIRKKTRILWLMRGTG